MEEKIERDEKKKKPTIVNKYMYVFNLVVFYLPPLFALPRGLILPIFSRVGHQEKMH